MLIEKLNAYYLFGAIFDLELDYFQRFCDTPYRKHKQEEVIEIRKEMCIFE